MDRKDEQQQGQRSGIFPHVFYGWYIVGAGMVLQMWLALAWVYGMQVFFTPLVKTFGWSRAAISGAFAMQRLEGSIVTPIEGFLVDRFGPRKIALIGAFIAGLGLISLSFLQAIWMFYASVLLVSLGTSASMGIPRTWSVVQWFRRLRGRALGIMASGAGISGPLLFIVVWLVATVGWRMAFVVLGVATWCICIPLSLVLRARPQQYGYLPDGDAPKEVEEERVQGEARPTERSRIDSNQGSLTVRQALGSPAFWILNLVFGAQSMGTSGLIVHQIPYFESIGFTRTEATSVLAIFTMLSVIGRLGGGWAMDFFDKRLALAGLVTCQATAFLILANITAFWQVLPFALLYGLAFGGMMPARGVIMSTYFGTQNFGAIQGLSQSATVVGGMVAPVLMGWVFDTTQSYVLAIYILMGVTAVAIPLTVFARPPRLPLEPMAQPSRS